MVMMFPEVKDDNEKLHKLLIDRSLLFKESFELIAHAKPKSLRNGLLVEFKDEVFVIFVEQWILLVCQALFSPESSLFVECPEDRRRFFPNPAQLKPEQLKSLWVLWSIGIAFDRVFLLQLEGEEISLEDIRCLNPIMYMSCKKILEMDADFVDSDAMGLTFFGSRKTVELCHGGNNIVVNSKKREQYVHLLIQHFFRRLAKSFFQAIDMKGLDCALLGGDNPILLKDWKTHTRYEGYRETDEKICWFWKVVESMSMEQQRELLFFWTSVKYLPVNGFSGLPYPLTIYKTSGSDKRLSSSHTCFFRLSLPHYPSLAIIQHNLSLICQRHVGCSFGFV
ncbi:hypothetical protein MKW94_013701 [Papaver nudicaule]|uniref:HECT-type E3 ubiquitin transferase n=1 Tax=Papaver nudicaule TaxID=74823 RepID=A0AA41VGI4_PAPNU|nr:hypothetical protein [Papaver nudicaule]